MSQEEGHHSRDGITQLLRLASQGDEAAFDALLTQVYDELKRVARSRLRSQRPGHTLSATALVHEAYLKLVDHSDVEWHSRVHVFAVASNDSTALCEA